MAVANLITFAVWRTLPGWTAIIQKWCALKKGPWSYACMKKLFSFFLLIYSQCGRWLSWLHETLLCVLTLVFIMFMSEIMISSNRESNN